MPMKILPVSSPMTTSVLYVRIMGAYTDNTKQTLASLKTDLSENAGLYHFGERGILGTS